MGFFDSWKVDIKTYLKHPVLFPGNIIEGYVEIKAKSEIDFVAVRVKLTGKEKVRVERMVDTGRNDENGHSIRESRTFSSSNVVYKQLVTLAGAMKCSGSRQNFKMPAGTWTYPFAFQLPMDLPPSFSQRASDDMADCLYYIKAYVDIPMGRDANHKTHFTLLKPMPASQWGHAAPVSVDRYFDITCCCCVDKGKVNARMYMDRTLISMDRDNLTVCVAVDNTAGKEPVEGVEFSLSNLLVYTVNAPWQRIEETNRVRVGHNFIKQEVPAGEKGLIQGVIPIPRDITPTLKTWGVSSEYSIQLELNIPWASDPSHTFPVIVAQAVDDNNFTPPVVFNNCSYQSMPKGQHPEFAYTPPPQPVYNYQPMPSMQMPQGPQVNYQYNMQQQMPLPPMNAGWAPPQVYNNGHQTYGAQVQWNTGVSQPYQQIPQAPPAGGGMPGPGGMPPANNNGGMPPANHQHQQPAASGNEQDPLLV